MTNFYRGKHLVDLCRHDQAGPSVRSENDRLMNISLKRRKTRCNNKSFAIDLLKPKPNLENINEHSIWTQNYSMTTPVFHKFNEHEISDEKFMDEAIFKFRQQNDHNEQVAVADIVDLLFCTEELESSSEDFDSDDSIKDRNYVPEDESSDSEEYEIASMVCSVATTVHIPTAKSTRLKNCSFEDNFRNETLKKRQRESCNDEQNIIYQNISKQVLPLKSLCRNILNNTYKKQVNFSNTEIDTATSCLDGQNKNNKEDKIFVIFGQNETNIIRTEDNNELVQHKATEEISVREVGLIENVDICESWNEENLTEEANKENEFHEVIEEQCDEKSAVESEEESGNNLLYTKSGNIRKRKLYDTSLADRQLANKTKYREQFRITEGCDRLKCTKKCLENFSEDERENINNYYWNLSWRERRVFIQNSSYVSTPKRKITTEPKRFPKRTYFFKNFAEKQVDVCKIFFLTTLGYKPANDKVLYNALNKDNLQDNRGKHLRTTFINRTNLTEHIESFHPTNSHYRREHAPFRKYLPSDLTVKVMYDDFCEKYPEQKLSYDLYRKHLKSLNISFAQLGHEECEVCEVHVIHCKSESHDTENPPAGCQLCKDYSNHKQKARKARALYTIHKDIKEPSHIYFSTDLEKVIMLPRMETFKEVVFCPRLVVHNQTFAPLGRSTIKPLAVLWHEATAGRKQQDIISAFNIFFYQYRDYEFIDLWLDNCAAQNKNWLLYFFLTDLVNSEEICATEIILNYFEKGHTFMSCDHFHHQVELSMKKKKKAYDFHDFVDCVADANSGKVTVKEMQITDFIDICDFTSTRRTQPKVYLKDIVQVKFKRGSYNMFYKTDYDGEYVETCFLKNSYLKKNNDAVNVKTNRVRECGIDKSRKDLILSKLQKLIPPHKLRFWQNISTA